MVRPSASPENKRISIAFAHMVTVPAPLSGPSRMSVCRTGPYSLYHALGVCCPSSVVNPDPYIGKHGLREIEFYKLVERSGFVKVRQQRSRAKDGSSSSSSSAASSSSPSLMGEEVRYLYAGRRWRDPRDEEDLRRLTAAWEELAGKSAIFAGQCGLEKVLRVCEEYGEGWREYQGRQGGGEGEAGPRGGGAGKGKRREGDEGFRLMETLQGLKVCPTYDCVLKCAGVDCFEGMLGAFGGEGCQGDTMKFASSDWGSPSSLSLPYLSKLDGCREKIDLNLSDVFTETDCMLPPGTCLPDSFADRETEFGVKGDMDILFSRVQRVCEHETTPAEIASIPEEERYSFNFFNLCD